VNVGDLVQRTTIPEWKAIVVEIVNEFTVEIIWLDTAARDRCSKSLLEVVSERR
jgi:hypothetical protein